VGLLLLGVPEEVSEGGGSWGLGVLFGEGPSIMVEAEGIFSVGGESLERTENSSVGPGPDEVGRSDERGAVDDGPRDRPRPREAEGGPDLVEEAFEGVSLASFLPSPRARRGDCVPAGREDGLSVGRLLKGGDVIRDETGALALARDDAVGAVSLEAGEMTEPGARGEREEEGRLDGVAMEGEEDAKESREDCFGV
jgi:hypothetical protein